MFGLYITIQKKDFKISPEANLKGMMLASILAASKASLGNIDTYEKMIWAKDMKVNNHSLKQLSEIADLIKSHFGKSNFVETGIYTNDDIEIIAIPTILVEKPLTLVGMGDTISSIGFIGDLI